MRFEGLEIYNVIPNRQPLMILDWLEVEPEVCATGGIKLKDTHWFFECHYPGNPIFPGCLLIETMTQVFASTFLINTGCEEIPVLYKIGEVSIKSSATIGDSIRFEASLSKFKRGIASGHCYAYKEDAEGDILMAEFDIVDVMPSQMNRMK